jgi:hypothetical protein
MRRALLLMILAAGPAAADPGRATGPTGPHREGEYGGVAPGQKADPAARPARPKRPPPKGTLTWIGFEAKDGGAQVFFQSVAPFEVTQHVEGTSLVVHLTLTRLAANTWRQIDTRFFDNPIAGMVARPVRASHGSKKHAAQSAGIDVRVSFKNPKDAREATLRSAAEADGMHYAYLSFPEGAEVKQPAMSEPEN